MPGLAPRASVWACGPALLKLAPLFNFLNVVIHFNSRAAYTSCTLLKRVSSGVGRMLSASFMTSSTVRLARCKIFVSAQLIGWLFVHIYVLSYGGFIGKASPLCSFRRVFSLRFVSPMYTLPQVHGTSYTTFDCLFVGSL